MFHHPKGTTIFFGNGGLTSREPNKYDDDFESLRFSIFVGVLWGRWPFSFAATIAIASYSLSRECSAYHHYLTSKGLPLKELIDFRINSQTLVAVTLLWGGACILPETNNITQRKNTWKTIMAFFLFFPFVMASHEHVQNPVDIPLYWLFNRDPYFMAYYNPQITG